MFARNTKLKPYEFHTFCAILSILSIFIGKYVGIFKNNTKNLLKLQNWSYIILIKYVSCNTSYINIDQIIILVNKTSRSSSL